MKTKYQILFLIIIVFSSLGCLKTAFAATQIWDEFPLVQDRRNFKESRGGKGVPSQGRICTRPQLHTLVINEDRIQHLPTDDKNWRYIVAMNCRRGDRSIFEIIREVETNLIAADQLHRLALVLGINERVTVDNPPNFMPNWAEILGTDDYTTIFRSFRIPIFLVYFQWTSFRESANNRQLGAHQVRELIYQRLQHIQNQRQQAVALNMLRDQDLSHQFPFGKAREFLLENRETRNFISRLHHNNYRVYIHIQDSDFISFQEPLLFGDFSGINPLVPANQNRLLSKFDVVITHHKWQNGRLPIIIGGAHVYNPTEDLSAYLRQLDPRKLRLDSPHAKNWTRFTSEMGNNIKHINGQQQPYGLYFHEPNSLILSSTSAQQLLLQEQSSEWRQIYTRLAGGFQFGIDSEVQEFTRYLFAGMEDITCRQAMVFSSTTVLSTSMKRGKKPFTIKFNGTYNPQTRRFERWTKADLSAMRGMSQEIISTNDWGSSIATSFKQHRISDARKHLYEALRLFDPIGLLGSTTPQSFTSSLIHYNTTINGRRAETQALFHNLRGHYDKLGKGNTIALQIITAGWETGQIMRLMFLKHLQPPHGVVIPVMTNHDREIQLFLSTRFNFTTNAVDPTRNPFVAEVLNFTPIAPAITLRLPVALPFNAPANNQTIGVVTQHPSATMPNLYSTQLPNLTPTIQTVTLTLPTALLVTFPTNNQKIEMITQQPPVRTEIQPISVTQFNFMTNPVEPTRIGNFYGVEPNLTPIVQAKPTMLPVALPFNGSANNQTIKMVTQQPPVTIGIPPIMQQLNVTQAKVAQVVNYTYEKCNKNRAQTARDMGVDSRTVPKLIECQAPIAWKTVAAKLNTPQKVREHFKSFSNKQINEILQILSGGNIPNISSSDN